MSSAAQRFVSLRGERAFARLRRGRTGHHNLVSVRWLPCKQPYQQRHIKHVNDAATPKRTSQPVQVSRVGFVVSKKVGNAVTRNKVRRRLWEGLHTLWLEQPPQQIPIDMMVIAKPHAATASYWQLKAGLAYALYKSKLLERHLQR
ncbi:MAG: ribonuclease P protein component [Deinococcota bacterium]